MINFFKNKKIVIVSFVELVIILVSIVAITYAWYYNRPDVDITDIAITTNSHADLLVSLDNGSTWSTEAALDIPSGFNFNNEVTSDGVHFWKATTKDLDGTPLTLAPAVKGKDYLEYTILFKSDGDVALFLSPTSFVKPSSGTEEINLIGLNSGNISSSGNFSRDLIAAGVRVSFTEATLVNGEYVSNEIPDFVWAPNKNYKVECSLDSCDIDINSDEQQEYTYIDGNISDITAKPVHHVQDTLNINYDEFDAHGDYRIGKVVTTSDGEGGYSGTQAITIRIWVEGNDRDTINALAGGEFDLAFDFIGMQKRIDTPTPNVSKLVDIIKGFDEKMEYSTDYGVTWIQYEEGVTPEFNNNETVYVRYKETAMSFASDYIVLEY